MLLLYRGEEFDPNFYYHSKVDIDHSFLLIKDQKILFVPKMNEALARTQFKGKIIVYKDPIQELSKYIHRKKVQMDFSSISAALLSRLEVLCNPVDVSLKLFRERAKKTPSEVASIKKAAGFTREIFASLDFKKAKSELDLEKQLKILTIELGLEPAFDPIVATDSSTSFPHYKARKKKIGNLVMIDYGVKYKHYCSDLTRCFILDGSKKKKEEYENLQNLFCSIIDELPNLKTGGALAKLSEKKLEKFGFPKLIHSIGHGVGLEVHELPNLRSKSKDPLSGTVLAIEPAFYLKQYGMRFEETVFYDGKKVKVL